MSRYHLKEFEAEPDPNYAGDDGKRRVTRASCVFKAGQVDCYVPPGAPEPLGPVERIAAAVFCGSATMTRSEGYYATLVHELTHGSGAKHRLDRELG